MTNCVHLIQVARELDKLLLSTKKEKVEKNWFKKAAEEMDIELSDDDLEDDESMRIEARKKEMKRSGDTAAKQAELSALLATPIVQAGFSGKYPTMTGRLELPKSMTGTFWSANHHLSLLLWSLNKHAGVIFQ